MTWRDPLQTVSNSKKVLIVPSKIDAEKIFENPELHLLWRGNFYRRFKDTKLRNVISDN